MRVQVQLQVQVQVQVEVEVEGRRRVGSKVLICTVGENQATNFKKR